MSDSSLLYVPVDPNHRPDQKAADAAQAVLATLLPQAESIESHHKDGIGFFDAGSNWSGVACSACGADAEDWWGNAMDHAAESGFEDLTCTAGCCGASVSLNDLVYGWPVAFGRFVLEVSNPGSPSLADRLGEIEQALGCRLREIQRHI